MARRGGSHTRSTRSTPHDGEGKGPAGHLSHARRTLKKTQLSDSVLASPSLRDELFSSISWAACCSIIAWPREMVSSHSDQGSQRKCQKAVLGVLISIGTVYGMLWPKLRRYPRPRAVDHWPSWVIRIQSCLLCNHTTACSRLAFTASIMSLTQQPCLQRNLRKII